MSVTGAVVIGVAGVRLFYIWVAEEGEFEDLSADFEGKEVE